MSTTVIAAAAALAAAGAASAASPFDGVWRTDVSATQFSKRPSVQVIKDGVYECKSCAVPYSVRADGAFHLVKGQNGVDEVSVTVVDARTVKEVDRLKGRVTSMATATAAPDGKTLEMTSVDTTNPGTPPIDAKQTLMRTAAGPAGSHATSGSWVMSKVEGVTAAALMTTFKVEGGMLKMSTPTGLSYAAKIDGPDALIKGDPGTDVISIKKVNDHEMVETDKKNGKVVYVYRMTVSPDGKTMTTVNENKRVNSTSTSKAMKV